MTDPHDLTYLRDLTRKIERGEVDAPPDLLALARQALDAIEDRKDEDVEEWARRLAADVAHLTD